MHDNCFKSRYSSSHPCTNETITTKKKKSTSSETLKEKDEDITFFGSILQFQAIVVIYGFLIFIIRDLFKSCIQRPQHTGSCYQTTLKSTTFLNLFTFRTFLEACSCSRYYFNLLFLYLIAIQIVTGFLLWRDRERAARQRYRVWSATHWLIAFAGGIPTAWMMMYFLRFKICVPKYYYTAIFLTFFNLIWVILYIMVYLHHK